MDRHTVQAWGSVIALVLTLGGTITLLILQTVLGRPTVVPDVLVNLDFLAGTAFFVNAAVQNGARSAGTAAAQTAIAAGGTPTSPGNGGKAP